MPTLPIAVSIDGRALPDGALLLGKLLALSQPLGPEQLLDTGFNNTPAVWTPGADTTIAAGLLTHTPGASASNTLQALATDALTVGLTYRVVFTISGYTAGVMQPFLRGTTDWFGAAQSGNGIKTVDIVLSDTNAGNDSMGLQFSSGFNGSIDNISLKQVG